MRFIHCRICGKKYKIFMIKSSFNNKIICSNCNNYIKVDEIKYHKFIKAIFGYLYMFTYIISFTFIFHLLYGYHLRFFIAIIGAFVFLVIVYILSLPIYNLILLYQMSDVSI